MVPDVYRGLMRHMEWADAVVWNSVRPLPEAHSDKRIRDCLYHMHVVQWAYLQIWRDEPPEVPDASAFDGLAAIEAWARQYHREVADQLDRWNEETLKRLIRFPWAEHLVGRLGNPAGATLAETILQITSHTTYHRGQVNMRLRDLECEPPLTDFIAWVWMGKPEPEWRQHPAA